MWIMYLFAMTNILAKKKCLYLVLALVTIKAHEMPPVFFFF